MKKIGNTTTAWLLALALILTLTQPASALFGFGQKDKDGNKTEDTDDTVNTAPGLTAQDMEIKTYKGIPYEARFLGSTKTDADEILTYTLQDLPKKGKVTVNGATFTYTPNEGAVGKDRFTYIISDSKGNVTQPASVTVHIEKTRSGVTYADTADSTAAYAAQYLAETGIFTGSKVGEHYCFEPERAVSRGEFLALAMETAGKDPIAVTMTGFSDDAYIPTWAKAYVSAGAAAGIVKGNPTENGPVFRGSDDVTFQEAAAILNRVLCLEDVDVTAVYGQRETAVDAWAYQAVANLESASVLAAGSFGSPTLNEAVTRGDAAQMLAAAHILLEGQ